jgi:DNA mismatch repair protein MutL
LLPDNIANQIAAGEVIQRPASAVKELLENAVDAGATEIKLIIQDAGKSLVQVIDNGKGMSPGDARMAFERHATSKIRSIDDLFSIRTMGFRGEALASIAAVAQVELRTRRSEDALGTFIEIENSRVRKQEACAAAEGTSIAMKNLFFNVPARRNFLKSNAAEMKHIVDEFIHVSLAFPEIAFELTANGQELFILQKGNLKQRIVQLFGNGHAAKLVPVGEHTDYLDIKGFVGKPEAVRKSRGEQFFFVNGRFIRSAYLNHAVMSGFQGLIPEQTFPLYVLFIDLDPAQIDINVHPTKQEIKFEDEKIVYAFVQSAVRHALAQFSMTPSLDFELDAGIQQLNAVSRAASQEDRDTAGNGSLFQTFTQKHAAWKVEPSGNLTGWKEFYKPVGIPESQVVPTHQIQPLPQVPTSVAPVSPSALKFAEDMTPLQVQRSYIIFDSPEGLVIVHQQLAHERVIYERLNEALEGKPLPVQQLLFPASITLPPADAALMQELIPELRVLGYMVESEGPLDFLLKGTPSDLKGGGDGAEIEKLLESYKHFNPSLTCTRREKLIRSMAARQCVKAGTPLSVEEMRRIISDLSACRQATLSVGGLPTFVIWRADRLDAMFFR